MNVNMKTISVPLTKGGFALVDECDAKSVIGRKWYAIKSRGNVYARTAKNKGMHRIILGLSDRSKIVDHINGNGLDNRRANLRVMDVATNVANRQKSRCGNKCPGVYVLGKKWRAKVTVNYKVHHLGLFTDEVDAIAAVNAFRVGVGRPPVIVSE